MFKKDYETLDFVLDFTPGMEQTARFWWVVTFGIWPIIVSSLKLLKTWGLFILYSVLGCTFVSPEFGHVKPLGDFT